MRQLAFFLLLTHIAISCGSIKDQQILEESEIFKQEISTSLPEVKQQLKYLESYANQVNIQGRALSIEEMENTAAINASLQSFSEWERQYEQAQHRLKNEVLNPTDLLNGYKRAAKELKTIAQRVTELHQKI